ncbi:BTB/POZ domain-containing protein 6-like [Haliotis rufescens]|uniref:BTB/POZ domain-containing protein 6-like n=1 Tax=Haliotis rufescens TaxID=6454 RepID=UPI00201E9053|nr:BTB/POZ domain-containing protein 6-like [Haliotis rufescens]
MSSEGRKSLLVDNWQSGKTITECNLRMLNTGDFSDVTFRVGSDKQVVGAHRYILVSRCCVFHAMFCGHLAAEKGEITIPDIEPNVFREFLRYLYTDVAHITSKTVIGLMYTSRKYYSDELFNLCQTFLETSLSEDNACDILERCHGNGELDLELKALKILTEGGKRVIRSPGFVDICSHCLEKFLKSETLKLKEGDIFEAALSWTKARCKKEGVVDTPENRRRLLGEMRYEIRFTSLSLEYLLNVVGPSGVLTDTERIRMVEKNVTSNTDISPFKLEQRKSVEEDTRYRYVRRLVHYDDYIQTASGTHAISFSVSQDIDLLGCQLYGPYDDKVYTLSIRLFDQKNKVVAEPLQKAKRKFQGRGQVTDIFFPASVPLQPESVYTICLDMNGAYSFWGSGGKTSVTAADVTFTFSDSKKSTTGTSKHGGQLPALIFK